MIGERVRSYLVVRKLGSGGMGMVFEGLHEHTGRRAAIKVLHRELAFSPVHLSRFLTEALTLSLIQDPRIVRVSDWGRSPSGAFFLLMEFVPGESLREYRQRLGGRLGWLQGLSILSQIANAACVAHAHRVVHRDLKPDNIFVLSDPHYMAPEQVERNGLVVVRERH